MEQMDDQEELDIVDQALAGLMDELISEDLEEEEFNMKLNLFMALYADLVDDGVIPEAPVEEAGDEEKKAWIEQAIPALRNRMKEELSADSGL